MHEKSMKGIDTYKIVRYLTCKNYTGGRIV